MGILRPNNCGDATGTVNPITLASSTTTTATWTSAPANMPAVASPNYLKVVVEPNTPNEEIVYVTVFTFGTTSANVLRGQEGSTAVAHAAKPWIVGPTANDFVTRPVRVVSGSYSVAAGDSVIVVTSNNAAITMPAPGTVRPGAEYWVKASPTGPVNGVYLVPNASETIDGFSSYPCPPGGTLHVVTDGTNWFMLDVTVALLNTGDLITSTLQTPQRLAIGPVGDVLTSLVSGFPGWAPPAMSNPMSAAGDMIQGGSGGTPQRLAIGTAGQLLTAGSGSPAWGGLANVTNRLSADYGMAAANTTYTIISQAVSVPGTYLVTFNITFEATSPFMASGWTTDSYNTTSNVAGTSSSFQSGGTYWASVSGSVLWSANAAALTILVQGASTVAATSAKSNCAISGAAGATNVTVTRVA